MRTLVIIGMGLWLAGACRTTPVGRPDGVWATDKNLPTYRFSVDTMIQRMDSPDRDEWQKPNLILAKLGPLRGRTIVDIGSGTGYFSFRMADRGAHVVAADPDPRYLTYLRSKKSRLGYSERQVEARSIPFDAPGMRPAEAHGVLIVNTYQFIKNRTAYMQQVRTGMRRNGRLVIVNFKRINSPNGPRLAARLTPTIPIDEVTKAGFKLVELDTTSLPENYVMTFRR